MTEQYPFDSPDPSHPQRGANFFSGGEDRWHKAVVHHTEVDWDLYCEGYKRAADAVVDHFLEIRSRLNDFSAYHCSLAYPIVFLYRQYLELRLKELFAVSGRLLGSPSQPPTRHGLLNLWHDVKHRLRQMSPEYELDSDPELNAVEYAIRQFDTIDPTSYAFRYPVDTAGKRTLSPMEINLTKLKEEMDKVSAFLDGTSVGVSEYLNAKHEWLAEQSQMEAEY